MAAAPEKKVQPIVVKRIRKGGHGGHHGGAWKIAYADFVTAMMAFFLLMWLLGSTTKGDLKGIEDYFNTPLKVAMSGGSGAGDTTSLVPGGGQTLSPGVAQSRRSEGDGGRASSMSNQQIKTEAARRERVQLQALARKMEAMLMADPKLAMLRSQIRLDMTPDGLRIQIVDDQNRPMFDSGSARVNDYMRDLLHLIGRALNDVPNRLTLSGHTDSARYTSGDRGYSNWELSADRANASRRELIGGGMQEAKLLRVVGLGSAMPLDPSDPRQAVNRRISITVMNADAEMRALQVDQFVGLSEAPQGSALDTVNQVVSAFRTPGQGGGPGSAPAAGAPAGGATHPAAAASPAGGAVGEGR